MGKLFFVFSVVALLAALSGAAWLSLCWKRAERAAIGQDVGGAV